MAPNGAARGLQRHNALAARHTKRRTRAIGRHSSWGFTSLRHWLSQRPTAMMSVWHVYGDLANKHVVTDRDYVDSYRKRSGPHQNGMWMLYMRAKCGRVLVSQPGGL